MMNEEVINKFMEQPVLAHQILGSSFEQFIRFFHWYMYHNEFIFKPFHLLIIHKLEDIVFGRNKKRNLLINIAPRFGKSSIMKYFCAWSYLINPQSNCIYTSYSDDLVSNFSKDIREIVESPAFKAFSGIKLNKAKTGADYWATEQGGGFRAAPLGGSLTGFGYGISGDVYGGCCLVDDPLKASNVKSQAEMQNTIDYYLNTLKSRANNQARSPMICIMQRLAIEDLSGYIMENEAEDWDIVKIPALDEEKGEALWPEKFSKEDLLKLKKLSPFVYYGQYQQEPIVIGGSVYKTEWFRFYNPTEHYDYQMSFITADTAQKKGEGNDFTVFQLWAKTFDNKLHLIDMVRGKFDAQELREQVKLFWRKSQSRTDCVAPYGFYIEDKSSGIGVIQEIKKTDPIPVIPIQRNRHKDEKGQWVSMDKFSRAMTAIPYIANGWVYLPFNEKDRISSELLAEAAAFKADLSAKHDDMCFVGETLIATTKGNKRLDQITKEDKVITPFGAGKILGISKREADVISNIGLTGTPEHKILCCHDYMFDKLKNMVYDNTSKLNLMELLKWKRQSLYYLMAENIIVANRKDISQLHTITKTGKVAEGFIEMFGNFIRAKKYLKAITFTTKMGIGSIMILRTLFVYHLRNIINSILTKSEKFGKDQICKKQEIVVEKNVRSGIIQKKQKNGTQNTRKNILKKFLSLLNVKSVEKHLIHSMTNEDKESVTSAEIENCIGSLDKRKKIVYNLKIDKGCYYANGILVSNCDAMNDAIDIAFGATGLSSIFI